LFVRRFGFRFSLRFDLCLSSGFRFGLRRLRLYLRSLRLRFQLGFRLRLGFRFELRLRLRFSFGFRLRLGFRLSPSHRGCLWLWLGWHLFIRGWSFFLRG